MIDAFMTRRRVRRVLDLLDDERRLILSGAPAGLAGLARRRAAAEADLMAVSPRPGDGFEDMLAAIRVRAERNRRLLAAFLEGASAGQRRLREIAAARSDIGAYDARGGKLGAAAAPPMREKRA